MKTLRKIISLIAMSVIPAGMVIAQDAKQEKEYIPVAGEWALGIDARPVFNFVGNLFNGNTDNSLGQVSGTPLVIGNEDAMKEIMPDVSIMGKYLITDQFALKANVGLMFSGNKNRYYVQDQLDLVDNPLSEKKLTEYEYKARNGASVMLGAEYRIGKRRVQGIFGGGLLFALTNEKLSYTFGNAMTNMNQKPVTSIPDVYDGNYRIKEKMTDGSSIYAGATASAGVEWFVIPKIALGLEMNLTFLYKAGSQIYKVSEGYNTAIQSVETRTDLLSPGNQGWYFGTNSLGGSLYFAFYF